MDGPTIITAVCGFLVVFVSGGSFAYVIHRNSTDRAHLSGMYEQKVVDLSNSFSEFRAEVKQDISDLREDVKYCREAVDGRSHGS